MKDLNKPDNGFLVLTSSELVQKPLRLISKAVDFALSAFALVGQE